VCDPATGREERALEHPRLVLCLAFGPRGERLVTVTDRCAYLWSVATGELLGELPGAGLWSPAFSPDGRRLAIGTWNREVLVYALGPGAEEPRLERRLGGHGGVVWGVAFHPDDPDLLVSTSALGHLRLWDVPSGRDLASIEPFGGDEVSKVTFAPGGLSVLVSGMHPEVHLIDLQHFDRHVAGSLPYQAARLRGESGGAALPGALDAWVDGVLARPWPRLDRRGPSVEGGRR
jgi:WD40 repeat protein